MPSIAYVGNTNSLLLSDLTDNLSKQPLNNASVTVVVVDATGSVIIGAPTPLSMSFTGQDGLYQTALSYALPFQNGKKYVANHRRRQRPGR